jgi:hypothetical protein
MPSVRQRPWGREMSQQQCDIQRVLALLSVERLEDGFSQRLENVDVGLGFRVSRPTMWHRCLDSSAALTDLSRSVA